ncbi:hypothetical protein FIBSPDRAFT_899980 [Athelia psychrophila]|uniref:Uncharacterized protein n=1 Tax=Athelia psychrophila TaxID=1759441 RepID=A0A165Z036_9AGAM|nr:hypothetical protein FIBSPDRAFT_899980 [Fibularhizoctonia sp. CBS 109695]
MPLLLATFASAAPLAMLRSGFSPGCIERLDQESNGPGWDGQCPWCVDDIKNGCVRTLPEEKKMPPPPPRQNESCGSRECLKKLSHSSRGGLRIVKTVDVAKVKAELALLPQPLLLHAFTKSPVF